ncbi:glycerol-3-phosphate 1-O-acyltransferase PlsY [candidate division KSB3 bacterium]|uniref:Glycerol-3-phosphate acyltransferase n=1 Tax=candidate division KSB3 bacterium TaxID=2044937 RepID=A0A9D5Q6R3_9BACT|nr:glycerol-3-phosphate 1-O-acyltransferase PlsY [candidate division KSB3 bacterium]MBD3325633.1 glycerol-3-phosphate 1-O-acyltransferase PlsY [candidate division KSB3 bacterium]
MPIALIVGAYLVGAIPFGFLIGKSKGVDVRKYGSGSIGTSNVARTLGKQAAILTLLGDGLKGLIPVLLAKGLLEGNAWTVVATGLAAVAGHNWPVYLKFKGGKGVTTTYGAFLGIAWLPASLTILAWVLISALTKTSSLAALISSLTAPLFAYALGTPRPVIVFTAIAVVMIYLRHTTNIKRLLTGTENRLTDNIQVDQEDSESRQPPESADSKS